MGDEDHGVIWEGCSQALHEGDLGVVVESRAEFVQEQDATRTKESASDGDALSLAFGQAGACL